jgi:lysophospholipase L1-like esterase
MRHRRRFSIVVLLTLLLTLPTGLLHTAAADPLTIFDECVTHIGKPGAPSGFDVNGKADCDDRERPNEFRALHYYALGDSVAAGHGLMDDGDQCRRSQRAYPMVVRELLAQRYDVVHFPEHHFLACSGAEATTAGDARTLSRQVDQVLAQLTLEPTLVTITIGANDFNWSSPMNFASRLYSRSVDSYESWVAEVVARIKQHLRDDITRLLEHENVTVVVTEYYNPFNTDSVFFLSPVDGRCAFRACYERASYGVNQLNAALGEVVQSFAQPRRVTLTSGLFAAFEEHKAPRKSCGNHSPAVGDTWIQHRTDKDSNSNPNIYPWFGDRWGDWNGDCFHPNAEGARQIATFVNQAVVALGR